MRSNYLLLLLGNLDTHVFGHDETGDTLVPGRWVDIGEYLIVSCADDQWQKAYQESLGFAGIGDPSVCQLLALMDKLTPWFR
jgi:hypothetical protein